MDSPLLPPCPEPQLSASGVLHEVESLTLSAKPHRTSLFPRPIISQHSKSDPNILDHDINLDNSIEACRRRDAFEEHLRMSPYDSPDFWSTSSSESGSEKMPTIGLADLPEELQQSILSILLGNLKSTSSAANAGHGTRDWRRAMRHPRAKEITNLALVSRTWRKIVQERLYRHITIKGTRQGLEECQDWFLAHPHLQHYVRHPEFWVPVWERRAGHADPYNRTLAANSSGVHAGDLSALSRSAERLRAPSDNTGPSLSNAPPLATTTLDPYESLHSAYQLSSQRATLAEIFHTITILFAGARVLTIEGGHCKKPPAIQRFRPDAPPDAALPVLAHIQTLVLRGAWNTLRSAGDFAPLARALPALRDFQAAYAKPKLAAYAAVHALLRGPLLPRTLTHLTLHLDGFYHKKPLAPPKALALRRSHHCCAPLGRLFPQLEALTLTGRVCAHLFAAAADAAPRVPPSQRRRFRACDLVLKNVCRPLPPACPVHGPPLAAAAAAPDHDGPGPPMPSSVHIEAADSDAPHIVGPPGALAAGGSAAAAAHVMMAAVNWTDTPGISNPAFIAGFEALVLAAARALAAYPAWDRLRVRFVDLEAAYPLLAPYFTLAGDAAAGVWSEPILAALAAARPKARFADLNVGDGKGGGNGEGPGGGGEGTASPNAAWSSRESLAYPSARPTSIKASSYRAFAEGATSLRNIF